MSAKRSGKSTAARKGVWAEHLDDWFLRRRRQARPQSSTGFRA